jgi:hypothetical protein
VSARILSQMAAAHAVRGISAHHGTAAPYAADCGQCEPSERRSVLLPAEQVHRRRQAAIPPLRSLGFDAARMGTSR